MSLQLLLAPADQARSVRPVQYAEGELWSASESVLLRVAASGAVREVPSVPAAESDVLDRLGKALCAAGFAPDILEPRSENTGRLALIAKLLDVPQPPVHEARVTRPSSCLPKWRLKRVVEYVEAHISEDITLADLALASGMSRMYFASQFRAATGLRPHEYVLRKRIARAQHILFSTRDPLVDVALSVGFQTQSHFTTVFKRIVGTTPHQWRRDQIS